jgi:hypothetical protein
MAVTSSNDSREYFHWGTDGECHHTKGGEFQICIREKRDAIGDRSKIRIQSYSVG